MCLHRVWIVVVAGLVGLVCVGCRSGSSSEASASAGADAAHTWILELVSHQGYGPVKGRIGIDSRKSDEQVEQIMADGIRAHCERDDVRADTEGILFSTQLMSPPEETALHVAPGTDALAGGKVSLHMTVTGQRLYLGVTPEQKYFVLVGDRKFLRDTRDEAIDFLVYVSMNTFRRWARDGS